MTEQVKHQGTPVSMGGKNWIVPPLNLRALRELRPKLAIMGDVTNEESVSALIEVVRTALARNYPEITTEQVEDMIDLGNIAEITSAIVKVNMLVPNAMGSAPAPVAEPSRGTQSTQGSPAQQDGVGSTSTTA